MRLIDIARLPRSAPEGDAGASGGGAPPAAGADVKATGGKSILGGAKDEKAGEGAAAVDGGAKKDDQKGDDKSGDASDPAKAKKDDAVPEFKVEVPEGVKVDEARLEKFSGWAKEAGLTAEQASKALGFYGEMQKADETALDQADAAWAEQLKGDKEFGGKNFEASATAAQKAVLKFGGRELAEFLEEARLGNHPLLAKTFAKIGRAFAEDTAATDVAAKGGGKPTQQERLARMYDHPDSQQGRAGKK